MSTDNDFSANLLISFLHDVCNSQYLTPVLIHM